MKKVLSISLIFIFFASPVLAMAATVTYMEAGTDETQDFTLFASRSGSATSDTAQFVTGPRSAKLHVGGGTTFSSFVTPSGIVSDTGTRVNFWFRADAANGNQFFSANGAGGDVVALRYRAADKKIELNNGIGTTLAVGTAVLNTNTWYRITVCYTVTSTTIFRIQTYVNGVSDINLVSSGTLNSTGATKISFALFDGSATVNEWIDDIYVDNGSNYADTGDIRVTAKRPFSNGALNQWTTQIGSGGSGYGTGHASQVNEQPLSTTNGWSIQNASTQTEEYAIEPPSVGDVNISNKSIVDYMGWVYEEVGSNSTGNIIVGGVKTNKSITTSYGLFTQVAGSTAYPLGNNAIGVDTNAVNQLFSLAEAGILVAYKNPVVHKIVFKNFFKFILAPINSRFKFIFN